MSFAKSQGCSPLLLIEANYPPRQLNGPFTLNELIEAKVPRYYLLQAGLLMHKSMQRWAVGSVRLR